MLETTQLDAFFKPKSIAVIGAKDTKNSVGCSIMTNLISGGFQGRVIPINPNRSEVLGLPCFQSVQNCGTEIDLAIIVVPAERVFDAMKTCVDAHVKAVVVIAAGFKETGPEGARLEQMITELAKENNVRMIGPNCLGLMNPKLGLNASFANGNPLPGSIAFISQSGAMCSAVLDWSLDKKVGFSAFVSIGSMADVGWADLIRYFGNDTDTKSILMYMETIGNPRAFIDAARRVGIDKPIIVIKPGRTEQGAKAATSHTGSLVGSDAVFDAVCQRAGVLRVNTVAQLFDMAEVRGNQPAPMGPRLAIISNAGGPAVLATDAVIKNGAQLAKLENKLIETLNNDLPAAWSHGNPIDILGDADHVRYRKTLECVAKDPSTDGVLIILTPQVMSEPEKVAEEISKVSLKKPLLASFMGARTVEKAKDVLSLAKIPNFEYPDEAAASFSMVWKHSNNLRKFCIPPRWRACLSKEEVGRRKAAARAIMAVAVAKKRSILNERESKSILKLFGIPVVETFLAKKPEEAITLAQKIGFPVVLKIESSIITHKSDVGGVILNVTSAHEVLVGFSSIKEKVIKSYGEAAFDGVTIQKMIQTGGLELIAGSYSDPQFGPVLLFGAGGIFVEAFQDRVLGLPPLTSTQALHMIEETKISSVLSKWRGGGSIPLEPIEDLLTDLGQLVLDLPEISEVDVNPIIASSLGLVATDARMILSYSSSMHTSACKPYPLEMVSDITLDNGFLVHVGPIRPEDACLMTQFEERLSSEVDYKLIFSHPNFAGKMIRDELLRLCADCSSWNYVVLAQSETDQRYVAGIAALDDDGNYWSALDERFRKTNLSVVLKEVIVEYSRTCGLGL
jgi:acetyltransferase